MKITESQLRQIIREEIMESDVSMSMSTRRAFTSIMSQVGEDGRTPLRDIAPNYRYTDKGRALRAGKEMGLLNVIGDWVEVTDAGYKWLATNIDPTFGKENE